MTLQAFLLILVFIGAGFFLLSYGANWLVKGSSRLARRFGVSPLVIGLTIVAFGTSAPELVTSLFGGSTIALGNVVGSNIFNLGLILGLTALVMPLACQAQFLRFEMPLMVAIGPLLWLFAANGMIGRVEGLILVLGLIGFIVLSFKRGAREPQPDAELGEIVGETEPEKAPVWKDVVLIVVGLTGLVFGSNLLIRGVILLSESLGVSERIIAFTVVAGGTSLPELATSVVAARKKEGDIALGNLVGSNIFNILAILGIVGLVRPVAVEKPSLYFDIPAMILVQALCIPIMITGMKVTRSEGALLLGAYVVYTVFLFVRM